MAIGLHGGVSNLLLGFPFRSKWQYVGGPFARDLTISPHLFVLSPNNKLLVTGGHWDNSFRVYSVERGKLTVRTSYHNGRGRHVDR